METSTAEGPVERCGLGGLILVGPGNDMGRDLDEILALPSVRGVVGRFDRLRSWDTASAEIYEITRAASRVARDGLHVLVYLDIARDPDAVIDPVEGEFVCSRLSQIVSGLADQPGFVSIYCATLGQAVLADGMHEPGMPMVGTRPSSSLYQAEGAMFPGLSVAITPNEHSLNVVTELIREFDETGRWADGSTSD